MMNRLILIGNGFDLAHGLKTKYKDFIDWYWANRMKGLEHEQTFVSKDALCTLTNTLNQPWSESYSHDRNLHKTESSKIIKHIQSKPYYYKLDMSGLLSVICDHIETKGWADIENDYYSCLSYYITNHKEFGVKSIYGLNKDFAYLRELMIEYLNIESKNHTQYFDSISEKIFCPIKRCEIAFYAETLIPEETKPEQIMLLNFNYTKTPLQYIDNQSNVTMKYIHGRLEDPQSIIFGYGDESDANYEKLRLLDDTECMHYIKQMHYGENDNYKDLMRFISLAPFQICIMGHSCGNSDKTLLNTLFEHKNCLSIKPYYYIHDNKDYYYKLYQSISKCCTNLQEIRNKVVAKTNTESLT